MSLGVVLCDVVLWDAGASAAGGVAGWKHICDCQLLVPLPQGRDRSQQVMLCRQFGV
jgi:hypothetical protein